MLAAYSGNSAYCFSNSLHMCLVQANMLDLPSVSLVECMTGMPFGAAFFKLDPPLFFPSPASTDPDSGLTRALDTMGWSCTLWQGDDAEAALAALEDALGAGPVLLGPLDLGYLPFDPDHARKRGSDHYVVALKREGELVQVHDPQLYPFAVLPMADLMRAWNATELGYGTSTYTLRSDFREERRLSREQMLQETLVNARELAQAAPAGPVAFGGAAAFTMAVETLQDGSPEAFAGFLVYFALPLGARRCLDAAGFLMEVGNATAARLMTDKAELYGQAQYCAVQHDWDRTAGLFDQLAALETSVAQSI
jgi:hypothetical protein